MKLKDIFNWIKRTSNPTKELKEEFKEEPFAMIRHKTRTLGMRSHKKHNNRKDTRGRHVQRVVINGIMKPIYHSAN